MSGILDGIRILDWGLFFAGPGASAVLGDLGAEVIKIEQPTSGDPTRGLTSSGGVSQRLPGGRNVVFEASGRNMKSITVDLKKDKGREIVYRLVEKCDVFNTNYRKRVVVKLGMDYPSLSRYNRKLVYSHVSAYGPIGALSQQGGYDFVIQGHSGLMLSMGEPDMPPLLQHMAMLDQATATMASYGILAALLMRERTGTGQEIDTSILGTGIWLLYVNTLYSLLRGENIPKHKREQPGNPLRNYYRCKDGKWVICNHHFSGSPDKDWADYCRAIGAEELVEDARFRTFAARQQNCRELVRKLDEVFATKTAEEWLRIALEKDLVMSPVNRATEVATDSQVIENNYITKLSHPALGEVLFPAFPVHFSKASVGPRSGAPEIGDHTEEVLNGIAGYNWKEIEQLREESVI